VDNFFIDQLHFGGFIVKESETKDFAQLGYEDILYDTHKYETYERWQNPNGNIYEFAQWYNNTMYICDNGETANMSVGPNFSGNTDLFGHNWFERVFINNESISTPFDSEFGISVCGFPAFIPASMIFAADPLDLWANGENLKFKYGIWAEAFHLKNCQGECMNPEDNFDGKILYYTIGEVPANIIPM